MQYSAVPTPDKARRQNTARAQHTIPAATSRHDANPNPALMQPLSPCNTPPHQALTLGELIEAGGVAEGADGSCLPAAPALHAHHGAALAEAESCMAVGFRLEEKKKYRGKENVLIQQMSLWSRQPCVSLHADSRALRHRARQPHSPACTTACSSMQQPLINSICARKRRAPPQKGKHAAPGN